MQTVRGFAHSVLGEPLKHLAFIIYNNILTKNKQLLTCI